MAVIKTYNPCPLLSCKHKYNIMANTISQDLFNKVRGQFSNMTLGRADGQQTLDAKDAVFFEFDYVKKGQNLGSLVVSLVDDGALKVYFNNDIVTEQDQETTQGFYNFLESLKKFAVGRLLNYEAKNISKSRLDKKDFDFLAQQNKTEEELTMESKLYGSRQKSYQDLNGAKLIVQHTQSVDEERHGARSRNIKAIYIENSDGERYRFENNYLPGARAMARHVSNGGYTKDDHGQHISEIMAEMGQLKTFVRGVKRQDYVNEDAQDIIEKATGRYYGLKSTLESISKQKGYLNYFENFAPDEIDVTEDDLNDIKAKLTRQVFDDRLQDSLGAVGKAMKLQEKKSGDFYDWDDWSRSAKQNGAEIQGDIDHAVAVVDGKEIGEWNQDEQDRTGDKIASRFKKPGYGELNVDAVDRDDTPERDFQMPTELKLIPGEMAPLKQASDKNAILQLVLVDIAGRAVDDEVSIFAADMADKLGSVGTPFGQRMTPEFKAQKIKAVDLAKMYLKQHSGKKAESVESEEAPRKRPEDPFESYQQSMEDIVLAKEANVDEGKLKDLVIKGQDLEAYAKKYGGIDKKDMMKVAAMLKKGDKSGALKYVKALDTDPRDYILDLMDEEVEVKEKKAVKDKENVEEGSFNKDGSYNTSDDEANEFDDWDDDSEDDKEAIGETIHAWWETQKGPGGMGGQVLRYFKKNEDYDPNAVGLRNGPYFTPSLDWWPSVEDFEQGKQGFSNKTKDDAEGWEIHDLKSDALAAIKGTDEGTVKEKKANEDEEILESKMICKHCGDEIYKPKSDCHCDCNDPHGDHWHMMENEEADVVEGKMSDIEQEVEEMIQDGADDTEIMAKFPGIVSQEYLDDMRAASDEKQYDDYEMESQVEEDDDIAWLKRAAGIGSNTMSNHGIREGEQGYQITPRSIVARQMRKLQDIEKV